MRQSESHVFSFCAPALPANTHACSAARIVACCRPARHTPHRRWLLTYTRAAAGLPSATISQWLPLEHGGRQLYTAVIVFLVDFMESLSIAKAIGRRHNYEIVVNKEIVAMGLANLMGGAFNCYTTTGSFSRTAVSSEVGARTPLQGIFTGATLLSSFGKLYHLQSCTSACCTSTCAWAPAARIWVGVR